MNPLRNSQSGRSLLSPSDTSHFQTPTEEVELEVESPLARHSLSGSGGRSRSYSLDIGGSGTRHYPVVVSEHIDSVEEVDLGLTFNGQKRPDTPLNQIATSDIIRDGYITPPPSIRMKKQDQFERERKFSFRDDFSNGNSIIENRFQEEVNPFSVEAQVFSGSYVKEKDDSTGLDIVEEEGSDHSDVIKASRETNSAHIIYTSTAISQNIKCWSPSSPSSIYNNITPPNSAPKLSPPVFHKRRANIPSRLEFTTPPSSPFHPPAVKPYDPFPSPSSTKLPAKIRDRYDSISSIQSISPPSHLHKLFGDGNQDLKEKFSPSTSNESDKTIRPALTRNQTSAWSSDSDSKSSTPPDSITPIASPPTHSKSRSWSKKTKKGSKGGIRNSTCSDESFFCFSDRELQLNAIRSIDKDKLVPKKMVDFEGNVEVIEEKEEKVPPSPGLKGFRLSSIRPNTLTKKKSWFSLRQEKENLEPVVKEEEEGNEEEENSGAARKLIPRNESISRSKIIPLSRYSSGSRCRTVSISSYKLNLSTHDAAMEDKEMKRKSTGSLRGPLAYRLDTPYCPSPIGSFDLRSYISSSTSTRNSSAPEIDLRTTLPDGEPSFSNPSSRSPLTAEKATFMHSTDPTNNLRFK